ncbi:immunoglobulin-like and fibronectin type III domain-containing protein 1 isoform X2 [Sphaeramia orbicularis]|uniref:immunoglobulin-like and fibronectin type III domain-containing protein 1 isoform X2 n=1 Tax=Sphaeramia orbicularis TaxID=375764 RepID=UPI0011813761|nr:immunoglobulin-like and fibronectin type III domain-containing protein 1 isoform X2 [Sphaeramia orbicularis]
MWKRTKHGGSGGSRQGFSLVHRYIQHFNEVSGNKSAAIRKRSKTTGVLVTQYVTTLPEGKSTPDFQCKPAPVTTQAGKLVVFKAVVKGDPKPEVSWRRAKGNLSDKDKYHTRYDESTDEYILEIRKVSAADIDTYKCYAVNEYGKAICTAALNVKEADPLDFRKLLKKSKIDESETKKEDEDERFWDAMINADKKDYERICTEFGVADMQRILQKLEHKKRERANKDGVIPQDKDATEKYRTDVSNNHPKQNNKGLNQEDVEDADLLPADFKLSDVDFVIRIQEIKAVEREDALFECVLTHPLPRISWMGKGSALQNGEKYSITVSDHKLIHRLLIKDCKQQDKGIYSAVAGITSCSAWLIVEADRDPASAGTRKLRKTTLARGGGPDLEKAAREQQIKYREEMEKILASVKAKHATGQPSKDKNASTNERDGEISAGKSSGAGKDRSDTSKGSSFSEQPGVKQKMKTEQNRAKSRASKGDGTASSPDVPRGQRQNGLKIKNKTNAKSAEVDYYDTDVNGRYFEENEDVTGSAKHSKYVKQHFGKDGDFTNSATDSNYANQLYEESEEFTESENDSSNVKQHFEKNEEFIDSENHSKHVKQHFGKNEEFTDSENHSKHVKQHFGKNEEFTDSENHSKHVKQHFGKNEEFIDSENHSKHVKQHFGKNEEFTDSENHSKHVKQHFGKNEEFTDSENHSKHVKQHFGKNEEFIDSENHSKHVKQHFGKNEEFTDSDNDLSNVKQHFGKNEEFTDPKNHSKYKKQHFGKNEKFTDSENHSGNVKQHFGKNEEFTGSENHSKYIKQHFGKNEKFTDSVNHSSNVKQHFGKNDDFTDSENLSKYLQQSPEETVFDENEGYIEENEDFTGSTNHSRRIKQRRQTEDAEFDENGEYTDENEDFTGSSNHSRHAKQRRQRENSEFDVNGEYFEENDDFPGSTSHSRHVKQSQRSDHTEFDVNGECLEENEDFTGSTNCSRHAKQSQGSVDTEFDYDEVTSEGNEVGNEGSAGSKKSTKRKRKVQRKTHKSGLKRDPNEQSEDDETEDSEHVAHSTDVKQGQKRKDALNGSNVENLSPKDHSETEDSSGTAVHSRRKRQGPLIEDTVIDPGVQFICGLSDVNAIIGETAELTCKLSSEDCEGAWFRDGKKVSNDDHFIISQDGVIHTLVINTCMEEHSGKYRFEADGRKTEAMVNVKDPPRFDREDLSAFIQPVSVKVGHNAIFKLAFVGHQPIKIQWYREGEELQEDNNIKMEKSAGHSRLVLSRCHRKDTGEIKIKLKNEDGFTEAISQLIVLDKPSPPMGPAEVTESSAMCIEFKWRPPKDDGGSPVTNYTLERQQVGRNTWKKLGEIPGIPSYNDTDVDHGRKYCYRIRAVTAEGVSEAMETDDMQAGTLAFPGPPAPPKVVSAYDDCINLSWAPPSNTGGSRILGYILEKRKKGSNLWTVVNALGELIKEKTCAVKDVVAGMEYEFRVTAINLSGTGEFSAPSEYVFARDPKNPPGKVIGLKVTETSYTHLSLTWTKPEEKEGIQDEAKGYFVEIRQAECTEWSRCNSTPIITTAFSVKGLKSMDMYWVRVIATNDGGEGTPEELAKYVLAMPSPVRPKFTNHKMKSFVVVRAGNSVRITLHFEASPRPNIMWLKDNVPVAKRVTISNSDGSSQLLIPSSERSDSGIYSILVKNLVGQETFSTEVRVTDDPKPPGPVELEENVPGTVTVMWEPSPDEKRDDRLHYTVSKLDSTKRTWATVGDRLFNNKCTVCNIMPGREYHFRVYAKNDMGISAPSESPTWGKEKKKEKFAVTQPTRKDCDLRCAPTFIVPLKLHTAPKGYECYMSCAVNGNPKPRITWYRNNISLNTNTNYYISNTCGVCSMLILQVGPKDMGEYVVTAENALGRAECSTVLSVRE